MPAGTGTGLSRRHAVCGGAVAGAALLLMRWPAAATASSMEEAVAGLLAGREARRSERVGIDLPPTFEYGSSVPLGIAIDSPMTAQDHVRRVDVFVDGNPFPEVMSLYFAPGNGPARASTRFRLEKGDHRLQAIAELSDGSVLTAFASVTAVRGGCGGDSGIEPSAVDPVPVPRINLPQQAGAGDIVEVPSMIAHRMETGFRTDAAGNPLPRRIINRMECRYAARLVFAAELSPAIAAHAYLKFPIRAVETGEVAFAWYEDGGAVYRATRHIAVD